MSRNIKHRKLKKNIYIAAEGHVTEKEYIEKLKRIYTFDNFNLIFISRRKGRSSPSQVLKDMERKIKEDFRTGDKAFIIIDRDNWEKRVLEEIKGWSNINEGHYLIISNPCFELWLLLHFEEVSGYVTIETCNAKLKSRVPNYNKRIKFNIDREMVKKASDNAKKISKGKDLLCISNSGTEMHILIDLLESICI